ncbi:unnamed protein product [Ostreobium quekettii]|uniref:Uncharacterized protein n=1 Tax=Ostreobium quekettii TaxID=121088 RepID=A0A8S1IP63_9CHLO|nr:unnamed protein product [Ostreobium quekettii]|eukprot:evm.model.scf_84.1 EVM.evm.TU.scf_84.1   scf_84:6098-7222(-)
MEATEEEGPLWVRLKCRTSTYSVPVELAKQAGTLQVALECACGSGAVTTIHCDRCDSEAVHLVMVSCECNPEGLDGVTGLEKDVLSRAACRLDEKFFLDVLAAAEFLDVKWILDMDWLHVAVKRRFATAVDYLLEFMDQLSSADALGRTPLHWACLHGDESLVKRLVDKGAIVNATDAVGKTAFQIVNRELAKCVQRSPTWFQYHTVGKALLAAGAHRRGLRPVVFGTRGARGQMPRGLGGRSGPHRSPHQQSHQVPWPPWRPMEDEGEGEDTVSDNWFFMEEAPTALVPSHDYVGALVSKNPKFARTPPALLQPLLRAYSRIWRLKNAAELEIYLLGRQVEDGKAEVEAELQQILAGGALDPAPSLGSGLLGP